MFGWGGINLAMAAGDWDSGGQDGGERTLYHGTDASAADDIVANGINRETAEAVGGGDVFWMSERLDDARIFSQVNPAGGAPAILTTRLPERVFQSLRNRGVLSYDDGIVRVVDWEAFNEIVTFTRLR